MKKVLFEEKQKFGSPLFYLGMSVVYAVPTLIFLFAFYKKFIVHEPFGNRPMSSLELILTAFFTFIVLAGSLYILIGSRLIVTITNQNISLTFKPILFKTISFDKTDIDNFEIRNYKPVKEYGGYGVRQGRKGLGKAYNVKGKSGLQLYLKNDKKVLIGTQRPDAILRAMKKMTETN